MERDPQQRAPPSVIALAAQRARRESIRRASRSGSADADTEPLITSDSRRSSSHMSPGSSHLHAALWAQSKRSLGYFSGSQYSLSIHSSSSSKLIIAPTGIDRVRQELAVAVIESHYLRVVRWSPAHLLGDGSAGVRPDLGSDYMEDWQRLSSMMLIDSFWEAVNGEVALVFQPDSVMCAASSHKIGEYVQYDYVGAPMAGPWWMTSDHDSQWSVGCGGFSLRNRAKAIQMCRTPQCITPAAGKLEDQQLGTMWKYLEKRCADAGIRVHKPSRFDAIQFAVEYDLQMDVLPGDDPARPEGCTANYYTGPEYDPGAKERGKPRKWNPSPKPAETKCDWPHFIPMGCHKCWRWNWRTWNHMKLYCPEAKRMREIRAEYKVGIEFTGWPTRPPVTPFRGPVPAHPDYLPVDMLEGNCKGSCKKLRPRSFAKTVLGKYHP